MSSRLSWAGFFVLACAALSVARADEIRVAVAANFSSTMDALAERFEASSEHTVLISSGSTGALYAQIRNGAPFDVFFAADARRPELLEQEGAAISGSRFTYAVGRIALWSREPGFVDAGGAVLGTDRYRFLAIANPELAPYGKAARQVLEKRSLWDAVQDRLVRGQDIGQTYGFVFSRSAELGVVAYAQLLRPGRAIEGSYWLVPQELHDPIEQQAVALVDTVPVRELMEFIRSDEARAIIRGFGYGP